MPQLVSRSSGSSASSSSGAAAKGASGSAAKGISNSQICAVFDRQTDLKGASISYVSSDRSVTIRESDSLLQTKAIIIPASKTSEPDHALRDRIVDVVGDCAIGGTLAYFGTVAACGTTVASFGVTAPLCAFSTVGAVTASLKCGTSISKMANHFLAPELNEAMDRSELWKDYENAVDWVDVTSNLPGIAHNLKNIGKLSKLTSKYGKMTFKSATHAESKVLYKNLAEEMGETFSKQGARRWANSLGLSPQFTPNGVTSFLRSNLNTQLREAGQGALNLYNDAASLNKRNHYSPMLPERDLIKIPLEKAYDAVTEKKQPQDHVILLYQQAAP